MSPKIIENNFGFQIQIRVFFDILLVVGKAGEAWWLGKVGNWKGRSGVSGLLARVSVIKFQLWSQEWYCRIVIVFTSWYARSSLRSIFWYSSVVALKYFLYLFIKKVVCCHFPLWQLGWRLGPKFHWKLGTRWPNSRSQLSNKMFPKHQANLACKSGLPGIQYRDNKKT